MEKLIYVLLVLGMLVLTYSRRDGGKTAISVGLITNAIILILLILGKIAIITT